MKIDGWNHWPHGYNPTWDPGEMPFWLRQWHIFPLVDRFAFPVMIRRGYLRLTPDPEVPDRERAPVPDGWTVEDEVPGREATWFNYSPRSRPDD